uniref:Uncharacterized protein n=1 Tax=Timema monikensis TaxID=170555 RepID=A0A7R9E664_9NEOP|nr:unnamed protein product [Timema monikensis]
MLSIIAGEAATAVLVCGGAAVYPVGWDNREVKESCGNTSSVYRLGTCELSWSVYLLGSAVGLLLLCFGLSFCASRVKPVRFHTRSVVNSTLTRSQRFFCLPDFAPPPSCYEDKDVNINGSAGEEKQKSKENAVGMRYLRIVDVGKLVWTESAMDGC